MAAVTLISLLTAPAAGAAQVRCPSAHAGGRSVGVIASTGAEAPIKLVSPGPRGVLDPPPSARVAGLSIAHAPLDAVEGATVLTWHSRFGRGCRGVLNPLMKAPLGTTFTVQPRDGNPVEYRIVSRRSVPKGHLRARWFSATGPHRLVLLTCTDLRGGKFRKNMVIIAWPTNR